MVEFFLAGEAGGGKLEEWVEKLLWSKIGTLALLSFLGGFSCAVGGVAGRGAFWRFGFIV